MDEGRFTSPGGAVRSATGHGWKESDFRGVAQRRVEVRSDLTINSDSQTCCEQGLEVESLDQIASTRAMHQCDLDLALAEFLRQRSEEQHLHLDGELTQVLFGHAQPTEQPSIKPPAVDPPLEVEAVSALRRV